MLQIITNYWLTWALGIISAGLIALCRYFYKLYKNEKEHQKTKEQEQFYKGLQDLIKEESKVSRNEEAKLQSQINIIQNGILSLQGRNFKQECREFLQPHRQFTIEEFEELQNEHDIYNKLGGNHDGDTLFTLVSAKAASVLTDDK